MTVDELVAFLRARLDEDEDSTVPNLVGISGGWPAPTILWCAAGEPDERRMPAGKRCEWRVDLGVIKDAERKDASAPLAREHSLTHATSAERRTLADVGAKRRIVELHDSDGGHECVDGTNGSRRDPYIGYRADCLTLRLLALPFADHPDYREEWRP